MRYWGMVAYIKISISAIQFVNILKLHFTVRQCASSLSTGARVHHEPWPLLLLPSIVPNPANFISKFPMPIIFRSSSESSHLIAGLSTPVVPSGFCNVSFLQGFCSCILQNVPATSIFLQWSLSLFLVLYIRFIIKPWSPYTSFLNWSIIFLSILT